MGIKRLGRCCWTGAALAHRLDPVICVFSMVFAVLLAVQLCLIPSSGPINMIGQISNTSHVSQLASRDRLKLHESYIPSQPISNTHSILSTREWYSGSPEQFTNSLSSGVAQTSFQALPKAFVMFAIGHVSHLSRRHIPGARVKYKGTKFKSRFCRRKLPYHLVLRCYRRIGNRPKRIFGRSQKEIR